MRAMINARVFGCPAKFVPVAIIGTGTKGAWHGPREEAYGGAGGELAASDRSVCCKREDDRACVYRSCDHGADVLSLALGVRRSEGGSSSKTEGFGA